MFWHFFHQDMESIFPLVTCLDPSDAMIKMFKFQDWGLKRQFSFCLGSLRLSDISSQDAALRPSCQEKAQEERSGRQKDPAAPAGPTRSIPQPPHTMVGNNKCVKSLRFGLLAIQQWVTGIRDTFGVRRAYFLQCSPTYNLSGLYKRSAWSGPREISIEAVGPLALLTQPNRRHSVGISGEIALHQWKHSNHHWVLLFSLHLESVAIRVCWAEEKRTWIQKHSAETRAPVPPLYGCILLVFHLLSSGKPQKRLWFYS